MNRSKYLIYLILGLVIFNNGAEAQQMKWITGYYPNWWYAIYRPGVKWNGDNSGATGAKEASMLDYSKLTHIVVFTGGGTDVVAPYCSYVTGRIGTFGQTDSAEIEHGISTGQPAPYLRTLIDSAHAKGVKVVISMGGIYGTGQQQMSAIATDPAKVEAFVTASCAYAKRKGADGIEINWEFPYQADQTGHNRLIRRFRQELDKWNPKGLFISTAYPRTDERVVGGNLVDGTFFGYQRDSMLAAFDQINIETYTMWQGNDQDYRTGFNNPINLPAQFTGYNGYSLNDIVKGDGMGSVGTWNAAQYPISRLGLSLSLETSEFSGAGVNTMGQKYSSYKFGDYRNVPDVGRHWDSLAASPWYADTGKIITFEDTMSIRLKVEWAKSKGFGGIMIYQLGSAFLPNGATGKKDILLQAVKRSVGPILNLTSKASAGKSVISASVPTIPADSNTTATITVQAKDSSGTNLNIGGDAVTLITTSGSLSTVVDKGDGTYTAFLKATSIPGNAVVSGILNGVSFTDTAKVIFLPHSWAHKTTISASASSIPADSISTVSISVQVKDGSGANITHGGDTVLLTPTMGKLSAIVDNGNGSYSAVLKSSKNTGLATVGGTLNGDLISDTAGVIFTGVISHASAANSTITANPLSIPADSLSTSTIIIQVKDSSNNNVTVGG